MTDSSLPILPRQDANYRLESILSYNSPSRVLYVGGPEGGEGKTWLLKSLQHHCIQCEIFHNDQLIDFYDTANQRVSGVMRSIIQQLDPDCVYFEKYNQAREEFDRRRAEGFEGRNLESFGGPTLDEAFLEGLRVLGHARRSNSHRGVVLFFDTFEKVRVGPVRDWVLEDLLVSCQDIAVVIAGRDTFSAKLPIITYLPRNFTVDQIENYVETRIEQRIGSDDLVDRRHLAEVIHAKTQGMPVVVELSLDLATAMLNTSDIRSLKEIAEQIETLDKGADFEQALISSMLDMLPPKLRWAVLFMSHLRRRFTDDIYRFLLSPAAELYEGGVLAEFGGYFFTKVRNLEDNQGLCVLPHDRVQDQIRRQFWEKAVSAHWVADAVAMFPPDLLALWIPESQGHPPSYGQETLSTIRAWLDAKIITYCEQRRKQLKSDQTRISQNQGWLEQPKQVALWGALQRQQDALLAEQLLYEMDRDLEVGWRRFRQTYDEAFDGYRKGLCEQLELTVLNAWTEPTVDPDHLQQRKDELAEIVRVRQVGWWIRAGKEARGDAIAWLISKLPSIELAPEDASNRNNELTADVLAALGWAHFLDVSYDASVDYRERAVYLWKRLGMAREEARSRNFLGESYAERGDFARATTEWELAKKIAGQQDPPDRAEQASVAMKQARYGDQTGDLSGALGYAFQAINGFKHLNDDRRQGLARIYQARIYLANARLAHAKRSLEIAETCQRIGDQEDAVRLKIGWSEYHRRRAVEDTVAKQYDSANRAFAESAANLTDGLAITDSGGVPDALRKEVQGELGTLYRDWARCLAQAPPVEASNRFGEAWNMWQQAEERLEEALGLARTDNSWFHVADLLDDLCDLYSDQYRHLSTSNDQSPRVERQVARRKLQNCLNELEKTAAQHGYVRFLSRVAEKRAKLRYEDGDYPAAITYSVEACKTAGLHTHSGHMFRRSYDKLVGDLEERLENLPDDESNDEGLKLRVELSRQAISDWARTPGLDPQLIIACERVLHPAQARLEELQADSLFEEANQTDRNARKDKLYKRAFQLYTDACHHSALRANDSYANYKLYSSLVAKLERRFYDLENPTDIQRYCELVEHQWHEYRHSTTYPTVIEICNRALQMSQLM